MFTQWSLDLKELAERAMFQQPANYFTDAALQEHWRDLEFRTRSLGDVQMHLILLNFTPKKLTCGGMLQHKNNSI